MGPASRGRRTGGHALRSGPLPGTFTGPAIIEEVLRRHLTLRLVIAHLGLPEYAEHLALAERYRNVYLDTTMVFTDFLAQLAPFPPELLPKLSDLGGKILLGSDFPNIPYAYAQQIEALIRLDLGDGWLRGVLYENAARLLGVVLTTMGGEATSGDVANWPDPGDG